MNKEYKRPIAGRKHTSPDEIPIPIKKRFSDKNLSQLSGDSDDIPNDLAHTPKSVRFGRKLRREDETESPEEPEGHSITTEDAQVQRLIEENLNLHTRVAALEKIVEALPVAIHLAYRNSLATDRKNERWKFDEPLPIWVQERAKLLAQADLVFEVRDGRIEDYIPKIVTTKK